MQAAKLTIYVGSTVPEEHARVVGELVTAWEHDNGSNGGVRRTVVVAVVHGPEGEQEEEGGEAELNVRLTKSLDGFVA